MSNGKDVMSSVLFELLQLLYPDHLNAEEVMKLCILSKTFKATIMDVNGPVMGAMYRGAMKRRVVHDGEWLSALIRRTRSRCFFCLSKTGCIACNSETGRKYLMCTSCSNEKLVTRRNIVMLWSIASKKMGWTVMARYVLARTRLLTVAKFDKIGKSYLYWKSDVIRQIMHYHTSRVVLRASA